MASPISFGDAYLMGKLALRLGRVFTKGRKSAPSEFREVENQLYSLSSALCALKYAPANSHAVAQEDPHDTMRRKTGSEETIAIMLQSCEETLDHLKAIVDKYSCMVESQDPNVPKFKRWSRDIKSSWKKISWTNEGGDLATLRSQLTVHTNSLNLILGVAIKYANDPPLSDLSQGYLTARSSQTSQIKDRVDQIDIMLREIYEWFSTSLKHTTSSSPSREESRLDSQLNQLSKVHEVVFELLADSGQGGRPKLICRRASLHPKWKLEQSGDAPQHCLFSCHCAESGQEETVQLHQARVAAYARKFPRPAAVPLSPSDFPL